MARVRLMGATGETIAEVQLDSLPLSQSRLNYQKIAPYLRSNKHLSLHLPFSNSAGPCHTTTGCCRTTTGSGRTATGPSHTNMGPFHTAAV